MEALRMALREVLVTLGVVLVLIGMSIWHPSFHDRKASTLARWALRARNRKRKGNKVPPADVPGERKSRARPPE